MKTPLSYTLLWASTLCWGACASLLNNEQTRIKVITPPRTTLVVGCDTFLSRTSTHRLHVSRSKTPLHITASRDSVARSYAIPSHNSLAWWLNLYPAPHLWAGFWIDRNKPKRYAYPKLLYLDPTDARYHTYYPWSRKGQWHLHIALPHINSFLLHPEREPDRKLNTGFWGFSTGLEYYHSASQSVRITASWASDYFLPVPAAVDLIGTYELMTTRYLSVAHLHSWRHLRAGYGLCFAQNAWDLQDHGRIDIPSPSRPPVKKSAPAVGFVFPLQYQLREHFYLGIVYRPTFFRPSTSPPVQYEHFISIAFGWRFRLPIP